MAAQGLLPNPIFIRFHANVTFHPHDPITTPKVYLLTSAHWGVGFNIWIWGRHTHFQFIAFPQAFPLLLPSTFSSSRTRMKDDSIYLTLQTRTPLFPPYSVPLYRLHPWVSLPSSSWWKQWKRVGEGQCDQGISPLTEPFSWMVPEGLTVTFTWQSQLRSR